MRKLFLTLTVNFILVISALGQYKNFIDQPYIEVMGYADTLVTPNRIYIKIVLSEKDNKNKMSVEEQENKMFQILQNLGINIKKDLTVSDFLSSYKHYLFKQNDNQQIKKYILKVENSEIVNSVFSQLDKIGISNISIDKVEHSDIDKFKNICRIRAIKNSKEKAMTITKAISQTLGKAIYIKEKENNDEYFEPVPVYGVRIRGFSSFKSNTNEQKYKIDFEKIKVSSTIEAKYILKYTLSN